MATPKKTPSTAATKTAKAKAPAKAAPAPAKPAAKKAAPKTTASGKPVTKKAATEVEAKPATRRAVTKKPAAAPAKPVATKTEDKPAAKKAATQKPTAAPAKLAAAKAEAKPAAKKAATASTTTAAARRVPRESLTPEERERIKKLRATLDLLKTDPEWPAFLEEQKTALLNMRDHLLPNMQNTTRDHLRSGASNVSSSSGQHIGDAGSEAEVRDLTINLLNKDREQLFEIDAALERIRRGTYGICEISLEIIPKGRLRVRPFCRLTVKCQEEYEKKYGSYANYRAKNSDHVGYSGLQNDMKNAISLDDSEE